MVLSCCRGRGPLGMYKWTSVPTISKYNHTHSCMEVTASFSHACFIKADVTERGLGNEEGARQTLNVATFKSSYITLVFEQSCQL